VLKTDCIEMSVIDEADRLLDLGFAKDMRFILSKLPSYKKRQTMLFSATLSHRVLELTYEYMNLPEFVSVAPDQVTVAGIEQVLYHVGQDNKLELLLGLLKREEWHRLLIFVNTKAGVEWLTLKLKGNGWAAEGITGDLPQRKRFQLMDRFKKNTIQILVATDVASRGIHIEDISHVINYDLPQDAENYVHRIGRTARAGKTGRALSLACEKYVYHLEPLEEMLGYAIPVEWSEDDWLVEDQCGPVCTRRQARQARTKRRVNRGQAGRRDNGPRTRNTGKGHPRRRDTFADRPPGYFPGTFFGFAPKAEEPEGKVAKKADSASKSTAKAAGGPEPKPKKKRRRPRKTKSAGKSKTASAPGSPSSEIPEKT
jgi:ATP-dependent RNA helicase RhlB